MLFTALGNGLSMIQNYTGSKECDKPLSVTNPEQFLMVQDFSTGWSALMCTNFRMSEVNGIGSLFPDTKATQINEEAITK